MPARGGEEVHLRLLGDPVRPPHRRDQLGGAVQEWRGVGDTIAALVSVPAAIPHRQEHRTPDVEMTAISPPAALCRV